METNELLVAAKAHDDYLLALDEAKRWWDAEDSLSAVIDSLDGGDSDEKPDGDTDRWLRASVVFRDDVIVGLREFLVGEGRAEPLEPKKPVAEPAPPETEKAKPTALSGPTPTKDASARPAPSTPATELVKSARTPKTTRKSAPIAPVHGPAQPPSTALRAVTPKAAAPTTPKIAKPKTPKTATSKIAEAKTAKAKTSKRPTAPKPEAPGNVRAAPIDSEAQPIPTTRREARAARRAVRAQARKDDADRLQGKKQDSTAWGRLNPTPQTEVRATPEPASGLKTGEQLEATAAGPDIAKPPGKSARWANTLIAGGSVLLLASLIGGLLLLTRSGPEDVGTAPSVVFTQCGPDRALGEVANPARVPATLDIVVEFTDGESTFFPVAVRMDVGPGATAQINVPATGAGIAQDAIRCAGFVSNFQPIS